MRLGGVLAPDGTLSGPLGEQLLADLHVKRAFLSATGLTEVDIDAAHLKAAAIGCAEQVAALVDSKFGPVDLQPFARLEEVSHLFTDSGLSREWHCHKKVRQSLCGVDRVEVHAPSEPDAGNWI